MIPFEKELRIKALRKKYIRYGKEKLKVLYEKIYSDKVTCWQIQKTIEKYNLYYHPVNNEKLKEEKEALRKEKESYLCPHRVHPLDIKLKYNIITPSTKEKFFEV